MTALCSLRERQHGSAANPPRGFLVAAHLNHGLRGDESDADEAFVHQLAREHDVRFVSRRNLETDRDEATLRETRLRFLTETAHQSGARYVALAHSSDDNVETVLHHLMRGTGPAGLAGIRRARPMGPDLVLVRPLLQIGRDRVRSALTEIGQSWRDDSSNADLDYRRNWIRHRMIPFIQAQYPKATDAISRAIDAQQGWRTIIDRLATEWIASHRQHDDPLTLRRDQATEQPIIIAATQILWSQRQWSRGEMNRDHWLRLTGTLQSLETDRYMLPGHIDVVACGEAVKIERAEPNGTPKSSSTP
jgi:tRNA(Ile)-lysidine synthase